MQYRVLGRTGLRVSAVSLGTVSLGTDYGIATPQGFGRPPRDAAIHLLREAAASGITFFDTAPAYGESESLLGRSLGANPDCIFATKVNVPQGGDPAEVRSAVEQSIAGSRRALQRDVLDIVQIHNATLDVLREGVVTSSLQEAQAAGRIRWLGASVYGEEPALAVIDAGAFAVLQIALSVLDQRMTARVVPSASRAGLGVIVRSAFLKGALTPKGQWLPDALAPLRTASARAKDMLAGSWEALPAAAMRFCLSVPGVSTVLTGASSAIELAAALAAEASGPLDGDQLRAAASLALEDERLLNPTYWPIA